jgi:putative FmdB family regulatory protein
MRMPTYEFHCDQCRKDVALTLTLRERESGTPACPGCHGPLRPVLASFYSKTAKKS